jgi:hypothetical protein
VKGQKMNEKTKSNLVGMSDDILATSQDLNAILASGGVKVNFYTHYVNAEKEINGIEQLIRTILTENGAIFPKDSHLSEMRTVVVSKAMRIKDIEKEVRRHFGFERYTFNTLKMYLKRELKDRVCKIELTKAEDPTAKTRPHCRYYLAE